MIGKLFLAAPLLLTILSRQASSQQKSTTENGNDEAKYMFVVGGGGGTEIVPISEDTQIPDCLSNLKDHPDPVENSAGGALPERGGMPHICGSECASCPRDLCWRYNPFYDSWKESGFMPRDVVSAATAYHADWGIIMAGGFPVYTDVILTTNGEDFTGLTHIVPDWPEADGPDYDYCVAGIDEDRIFATGLGPDYDDTYMFSRESNRWTSLPKMPTGRYNGGFGCGVARDDAGKLSVVVVGGYYDNVEIYSVEEETWATGNNFPIYIEQLAVAQHEESFYVVGGYNVWWNSSDLVNNTALDTIYHYNVMKDSWTLLPHRMKYERQQATAMIVDSSIFPSCCEDLGICDDL